MAEVRTLFKTLFAHSIPLKLYGRAHLNFVTKLDRTLMEDFAKLVVQSGSLDQVASVHDQCLDYVCMYVCMENQLFKATLRSIILAGIATTN